MAPSRKLANGRSPLVNKQHQITAFFSKSASPSLKPKPNSPPRKPNDTQISKPQNPNPNPNPSISPSSSPPATPSPVNGKLKPKSTIKPLLVIGSQKPSHSPPSSTIHSFENEVVNRRIRVYWPLDEAWYEGSVKSFDKVSGKHLVEYDDGEEELIDLSKEKIEWIEVEGGSSVRNVKKRRLRKVSIVVDDEDEEEREGNVGHVGDDSSDEDWGKNVAVEEKDCLEEMEVEEEEEVVSLKRKRGDTGGGKGKKMGEEGDGEVVDSSKKKKAGFVFGDFGNKPGKSVTDTQGN